jgi:AraC-like DNA-binding protein
MTPDITYMVLFSANLAFIVTHLYGWLLKWYYKPMAYREHFHELFPAQRSVGVIYLLQLFELTYLFQVGDPDALMFVNAFALLFFSLQMLIMCELYFFPEKHHPFRDYWFIGPAVIVLIPFFLQAIDLVTFPYVWRLIFFIAVNGVFASYFGLNVRMALKIGRAVQRYNEDTYADSDDFPVRFANIIKWVPTIILILLAINFYAADPWVKFGRDILFIGASVWFCIYTLNPWRRLTISDEPDNSDSLRVIGVDRFDDLAHRLDDLLVKERIFTESHITIDTLVSRLGTNSKYLTEVIKLSGYTSFYDMISQHRVRYAIALISQQPDRRLSEIATDCGFASATSMNRAFSAQGKPQPSTFKTSC